MATCASPSSRIPMEDDDSTLSTPSQFHRRGSNVSSESSSPMLLARHFHGKWMMESPASRSRNENKTVPSSPSPSFPASEHPDWLGSFQFGDMITTGSTGSIRTGTHSETHAITTIVMVDKKGQSRGGRQLKKELMEMKNDEHPHVLKLYDVLETWNRFYLILEHAAGSGLVHHLLHHGALSRDESLRLTAQLIDATMYQQHHTTYMMDMEDVMLDHEMDIKLCDTRIRHMIWADQEGGPKPSHPYCSPPELLDTNISNIDPSKCDVWTIGCLFYLMLTGDMPFGNDSNTNKRIISGSWISHPSIDTECTLLLQLMLASTPTSRSTLLSLSTNSAFRDHTFLSSMPSSVTTSSRSLTSTPLTDVMMADVEEEDRVQPLNEKKELRTSLISHNTNTGIATLQSRLDHLHELALMSPNTHKRRISGQSVLPSSIYVPQSDPPTPSRSKSTSQAPSQSPSVAASPSTPFRSLSATASPSTFRRSLPHLTVGSATGSPREANRRLSSNSASSRARVVLVNENINGDEAIWRPTVVPSPARTSTTTIPRIPSPQPQPQPQMPLFPPLSLNTSKSNGATSVSPSIPTSPDLPARAITIDPSPRKLPIDPMYASPRVQGRPLKGFMPSFHLDTTSSSQPESPVNSRPRTPHPAIAVDDINATTIEAPVPIAATQPVDLMRPSPHRREMSHELAHLSIDAQATPHSTSRHIIPDRSHTGSITLSVSTPITTVTTPRVQPPPAKSSFPSSPPIAATCPMPTRRLPLPSPSSHDDHHTLIKNPIKAHHQHGYLTTSIYQMEIDGDIVDVTKKLIHVMKEMGITYKQCKNEMECEYTPVSTNDHIKSSHNLKSEKDDTIPTSTHDHVKFHIELKSEQNHTCIRLDHVFGSFDIYRTAFMRIRQALHQQQ